jgi:hypothetical protein
VADDLVTYFFCRFGVPMELHSDQGRNIESSRTQLVLERLGINNTPTPAVRWKGVTMRENDREAPEEGGIYSPTGLG